VARLTALEGADGESRKKRKEKRFEAEGGEAGVAEGRRGTMRNVARLTALESKEPG